MASYQMPQFLDSGDKILGPLNLRQFGYALGGFMLALAISGVMGAIFPTAGILVWVPAIPVIALAAYLALGKFNGRDTDIYAYKYLLFVLKPKYMTYQRFAYTDDLNEKLAEWTPDKINKRWLSNVVSKQNTSQNDYLAFTSGDSQGKAKKISRLGNLLDTNYVNAMSDVETQELRRQQLIEQEKQIILSHQKPAKNAQNITPNFNLQPTNSNPANNFNQNRANANEHNFFETTT